jgi:hypothetical protein
LCAFSPLAYPFSGEIGSPVEKPAEHLRVSAPQKREGGVSGQAFF